MTTREMAELIDRIETRLDDLTVARLGAAAERRAKARDRRASDRLVTIERRQVRARYARNGGRF